MSNSRTTCKEFHGFSLIRFPIHGDYSGKLVALEKGGDFPFDIKRVYYIWGTLPNSR